VEEAGEEREQRLRAIELEKGADTGEKDGCGGERAGCGVRLL
jgi:hypothetical protein